MDISADDIPESIEAMQERFQERAAVIEKAAMPPLEGLMRQKWIRQKEIDYQDFLMIADCDIALKDGILHLTLDLRPAICDATLKKWWKEPKIIKKRIGLSGYNPNFDYGGEAG